MSSPTSTRPVVTLHPSPPKDAYAYMAAIRLASSVRNSMDAQKAGVDGNETVSMNADSWGRYHLNVPPPPSAGANISGGRESVPILNQTPSIHLTTNTTKLGFVQPRDSFPSSSHSMSTFITPTATTFKALIQQHGYLSQPDPPVSTGASPSLEDTVTDTPVGVKLDASEEHHGYFPPPESPIGSVQGSERIHRRPFPPPGKPTSTRTSTGPVAIKTNHGPMIVTNSTTHFDPPTGSTKAPSENSISRRTGPIPIDLNQGHLDFKLNVPGGIPPQCQLYVTNTDINVTFTTCPVTKRNKNSTHDLASRQLHAGDSSNSQILAIRNTAMCEAPVGFNQRLTCGKNAEYFALTFFLLFALISLAWIGIRTRRCRQLDEEMNRLSAWPRSSYLNTNASEARLKEKARKDHEKDPGLDDEFGIRQYEPVAWRSASNRAVRANLEGVVVHDAGPVAELLRTFTEH